MHLIPNSGDWSRRWHMTQYGRRIAYPARLFRVWEKVMTTITWNNSNGGDWNTALDWTPNQVPGAGDDAEIVASGIYTVTITSNVAVNNVTTVAGATVAVSNGDTLPLTTGSTITQHATAALY